MKKHSRVYVEITNICNRSCSFCPGTSRRKQRMTKGQFRSICERLSGVTDYIYLHVMGEPTTHPELGEIIKIGTEMGYHIAITTNGTLLPSVGDMLIGSELYKINISIHSFEEGADTEYQRYISGCLDFADRASRAGILTVLRLWNRGADGGRNNATLRLMHRHFPEEWSDGASGSRIRPRLHLEYGDRFEWPDISADYRGERVFCHGLGDHFGILVDGTVVPCCLDREGAVPLGNIFDTEIEEILSGERATAIANGFRNKCATEELCRRCGYARRFKV